MASIDIDPDTLRYAIKCAHDRTYELAQRRLDLESKVRNIKSDLRFAERDLEVALEMHERAKSMESALSALEVSS